MPSNNQKIMTPANIVTLVRICAIPLYVIAYLAPWPALTGNEAFWVEAQPWIALLIFILISFTDFVDGKLARSRNEVTDFGKFLDPLADKILVCAALLCLVDAGQLWSWIAMIILAREFIISGLRMMAATTGQVIAASMYGKVKTWTQIIAICCFMVKSSCFWTGIGQWAASGFNVLSWIAMALAVIMTILSMVDYLYKGRHVLGFGPEA